MRATLHFLLRLFPAEFTQEFGAAIAEQIERDYDDARERGALALLWFVIGTAADLLRSAVAEHLNPTWSRSPDIHVESFAMQSFGQEWWRDLRHAARALKRAPGFTAITVATLGLAIGANAGMFSVIDTVLLNPLPFAHADRIVHIAASAPGSGYPNEFGVSAEFYVQYREQSKLLEDAAVYNSFTSTMRAGDRVERIRMSWPTYSIFSVLGVKPILGRMPVAEDADQAAVISYQMWDSWFHRDSSVIGKAFDISGKSRTVIAVMGQTFKFPNDGVMLWIMGDIRPDRVAVGDFGPPLVGRMRAGVTPIQLANELTALSKGLPRRFGGSASYAKVIEQHRAIVRPLAEQLLGPVARPLWVLLGAVAAVLLIACANLANLFLVRAESRQRDLAVRRAIGAGRAQLIRSQMAEAVIIAALAGVVAIALAALTLPLFVRAAPPEIPRLSEVHLNWQTLVFTGIATVFAAIACGLFPAVRASMPDLARLRDGNRGATRERTWARDGLVVAQTAMALVLLIGSGLLVRSFQALRHVNPGYTTENIFTFQIAPEGPHLTDAASFAQFDLQFMDHVRALPGVESVGLVENIPLDEGTSSASFRTEEAGTADPSTVLHYTFSAGDYYKAMGIKLLRGRVFDPTDATSGQPNVIVGRSAANLLWPGRDPIGRRLRRADIDAWFTVVGVVDDVLQDDFRGAAEPVVYFPLVGPVPRMWTISSPAYVVKTRRANVIGPEIRALVHRVAPTAPMYRVYTMAGLAKSSMQQLSFTMLTLAIVSALALLVGAIGLYGVLSYVVAQRTREIGVRIALGAQAAQVRRMVVAQGARVVAVGIAIGVGVAMLSTRALGSLLFGVTASDTLTFVGMSVAMVGIGLLASYLPARRASRVDPIESLRGD